MSALQDASRDLNKLAHAVVEELDAGAVIVLALILDDDGTPSVGVGSTGTPDCVRLLAEGMPTISRHMLEVVASGGQGPVEQASTFRRPRNEN